MHDTVLLGSSGGWKMGMWSGLKAWRGRYFKASGRRGNGLGAWWAQDPACHLGEEVGWVRRQTRTEVLRPQHASGSLGGRVSDLISVILSNLADPGWALGLWVFTWQHRDTDAGDAWVAR